jgi:superfamily II DNA or RNA helicase
VILDEAHKLTIAQEKFFRENTFGSIIVLTGTPPRSYEKQQILRRLTSNNCFFYTADEAIEDGILNEYRVYVYQVELDDTEPYVELHGKMLTEKQAYLHYCAWLTRTHETHTSAKQVYINMMRFLGTTKTKTLAAQYIMDLFRKRNRRFVVFCKSIEQAEILSPYRYHSRTTNEDYDRFKAFDINELASVNQIQEGANFKGLNRGLVIQMDTNPGNIIQKIGRFLRLDVNDFSSIFILCFKDTYDADWNHKALKITPKHKIQWSELPKESYWKSEGV